MECVVSRHADAAVEHRNRDVKIAVGAISDAFIGHHRRRLELKDTTAAAAAFTAGAAQRPQQRLGAAFVLVTDHVVTAAVLARFDLEFSAFPGYAVIIGVAVLFGFTSFDCGDAFVARGKTLVVLTAIHAGTIHADFVFGAWIGAKTLIITHLVVTLFKRRIAIALADIRLFLAVINDANFVIIAVAGFVNFFRRIIAAASNNQQTGQQPQTLINSRAYACIFHIFGSPNIAQLFPYPNGYEQKLYIEKDKNFQ